MPPLHTYGPGSQGVGRESMMEGYMPYSRVGELVANARIDAEEWHKLLNRALTDEEQHSTTYYQLQLLRRLYDTNVIIPNARTTFVDQKPEVGDWSNALPGYIAVQRKGNARNMRNMLVSETAAPVVVCAAGMPKAMDDQFFFAGIVRSPSIKSTKAVEDLAEHFTVFIGGVATMLNTGLQTMSPGDGVAWTFEPLINAYTDAGAINKRQKAGPRIIQCVRVPPGTHHKRMFGVCMSQARPGETFDVKLGPTTT